MPNANKSYTPFVSTTIVDNKGNQHPFFCIRASASRFEARTVQVAGEDRAVVNFTLPVEQRTKRINKILGTNFPEDKTLWIRAAAWGSAADRLTKVLQKSGDPKSLRLEVFGTVKTEKFNSKNGGEGINVILTVYDFWTVPSSKPNDEAQANNTVPAQSPDGYFNLGDDSDFQELGDDDNDVPF